MKSEEDEYVTIRIPKPLANEIDEIIRSQTLGYRTRAEMVKEAVRLRIEQLRFAIRVCRENRETLQCRKHERRHPGPAPQSPRRT